MKGENPPRATRAPGDFTDEHSPVLSEKIREKYEGASTAARCHGTYVRNYLFIFSCEGEIV